MLYLYGLLTGAALVAAAWWAWWHFRHHAAIMHALEEHAARLEQVKRVAENADAAASQLTEDLGDLNRRALALDPQFVYGVEQEGNEEAPAG